MLIQKKSGFPKCVFILFLLSLGVESAAETQPPTFEVKQIEGIYVPFQNGIPYSSAETQERACLDLNGIWKSQRQNVDHKLTLEKRTSEAIRLVEEEGGGRHRAEYDDSGWNDKAIPGVENPAPDRYQDGAWYRRRFFVPAGAGGKYIRLVFEAANYFTDVWINGKWVGCHEGGYTPFAFDISGYVDYGKDNVIAVRVDNIPWIPDGDKSPEALNTNDHNIVPYRTCDWWNYGGITRDVYAEISSEVSVVRGDIKSRVLDYVNAELDVNLIVYNHSQSEIITTADLSVFPSNIRDDNITEAVTKKIANLKRSLPLEGETRKEITLKPKETKPVKFTLKLNNFKYWSPEEPVLYILGVKLGNGKNISDEFYTQFGIRELRIDNANAKLLINGKETFLRGIARHEVFYGESGVEEYGPSRTSADFKLIKEINANFIRTAHYPNQHETYLLADRFGFLIWEEIPAYWFEGPEFDIQTRSRGIAKQMCLEMIYRDYNRPSVIVWGTCNECSSQKERAGYIRQLRDEAYKVDGTRPVAQSAVFSDPTDATQKECDLLGFTTYYGVFYGSSHSSDTKEALEKAHAAFPDKPILSTEYGIWAPYGDSAQEGIQVELARETFGTFKKAPYVCGATWWAGFDWHTMINEPQTMGAVTMDRTSIKPVYSQLQRQYASLLGDLDVALIEPQEEEVLSGKIKIVSEVKGKDRIEAIDLLVDDQSRGRLSSGKGGSYSAQLNTAEIPEGKHTISVRVKSRKGFYVSDFARVNIDNIDELPVLTASLKDGDAVTDKAILTMTARDDRGQPNVTYSVDGTEPRPMGYLGDGVFQAIWDVSGLEDGSIHEVAFKATDPANQTTEKKITVVVDNKPGRYIELPYNHDWISWNKNYSNGTGWDFPAEELPTSNSAFIYNGEGRVKFKFGDKLDDGLNNLESGKQRLDFAPGYYTKVHILATMHNGGGKAPFILHYTDGTEEKKAVGFSDWWGANAVYGESLAIKTTHHHEASGDRKPGAGIYLQTIEPEKGKILYSITLPSERRLHVFAMTLEGEVSNDAIPGPVIIEPRANYSVGDVVKITVEDKEDDIAKVEYAIDDGQWQNMKSAGQGLYTAQWDTVKASGLNHRISVKATDKIGQIGVKGTDVRVVNKVTIIFPFDGASLYKTAVMMVEPRANREVEKMEFQIDTGPFEEMSPSDMGLYTKEWKVDENYMPGSLHSLTVREYEKGGDVTVDAINVTADSVKVLIAEPLKGHTVSVDKNLKDWTGTAPEGDNAATITNGEYIWKDAKGDDTGNGHYTYPTNKALTKGSDLREFRVTWDDDNLYLMIKCDRPGDFWTPYRIIGIDRDGSTGGKKGAQVLAQGDTNEMSPEGGCYGNLKVSPELACEYAIGIFNSYKGRIWDANGKLIARKTGNKDDTAGFKIDDVNWNAVEVAIPLNLIGGNPAGQTWRFVVGVGQQDNDIFRRVEKTRSEWHGGGGETNGSNPHVYDLAGLDKKTQEYELNGYKPEGGPSDPDTFAVIKKCYLVVTFSDERPKQ